MSSFYQLIGRLQNQQQVEGSELKSLLGRDIEGETQDIESARREYEIKVETAGREMQRRQKKRSKAGLFGTLLGMGLSFTPVGALGGALIGGLASGLGRKSVAPYSATIASSLPGGKFHSGARKDLSADLQSTNNFIQDAKEGQSLLDWTSAISDASNIYSFGKEVSGIKEGFREWAVGEPQLGEGVDPYEILTDKETGVKSFKHSIEDLAAGAVFEGGAKKGFKKKLGGKMRGNLLGDFETELMNERLKRQYLLR